MKNNKSECYNKIFERIDSIENTITGIQKKLSIIKNILNNRKKNVQQNCNVSNSKETTNNG
jgi:hypothetical protein